MPHSERRAATIAGIFLLLPNTWAQVPASPGQVGPDGAYTVGGGVISPKVLTRAAPRIPDLAVKLRAAGEVLLSFVVQTDRTIRDIQVVRTMGYGIDEEAIQTVKKWRFAPGTKDGHPVDVRMRAAIGFSEAPDPHAWGAGPMLFETPAGSKPPKLESGTMPKPVRKDGNETVMLQFNVDSSGETRDIRPLQGNESTSLQALVHSLSTWKFEPSSDGATVAGKVLFIKGEDQFRYKVSDAFRNPGDARPVEGAASVPPAAGGASSASGQIIIVPVKLRLESKEAAALLIENVPAQYPEAAKRGGIKGPCS